jgi:hypothetical protein
VTFPVFKAGDAFLRGTGGGFDFHTLPPQITNVYVQYIQADLRAEESFGDRGFDSPT